MKHVNFDLFVSGEKCGLNMSINRESIIAACGYVPSELIVAYYEDGIFYEDSTKGVELQGASNKVYVDSSTGNMYVYDESTSQYKPVGGMTAEDKEILNSISTPASATKAGVIKVGEGLSIDADGILRVVSEGGTNIDDLTKLVVPTITLSGLRYPTILEDNNYTVTFTCGDKVIKKRTNGEGTMKVDAPKLGTWTATCIPNRTDTYTATVDVEALGNSYSMSMSMKENNDIGRTTAPDLTKTKYSLEATTIGNYALFGGGENDIHYHSTVDAYTSDLVRTTAPNLTHVVANFAATTVGNYALFGGGHYYYSSSNKETYDTVDVYTSDLLKTTAPVLSKGRYNLAATTIGNYALFGGGYYDSSHYSTVDAYTSDLVKTTAPGLSEEKHYVAATTIGNYALFGGGYRDSGGSIVYTYDTVNAYTSDLVRTTAPVLSTGRYNLAATTIGNYALFGGGHYKSSSYDGKYSIVDAYTSDLVKTTAPVLSDSRYNLAATTIGNYALFGGGRGQDSPYSSIVDAYTSDLVKTTPTDLSVPRAALAATTIGNYALFGGGVYNSGGSNTTYLSSVDAFCTIDLLPPVE